MNSGRKPSLTIAETQKLNEIYLAGFNVQELSKMFGMGHTAISHYIWEPRKHSDFTPEFRQELEIKRNNYTGV